MQTHRAMNKIPNQTDYFPNCISAKTCALKNLSEGIGPLPRFEALLVQAIFNKLTLESTSFNWFLVSFFLSRPFFASFSSSFCSRSASASDNALTILAGVKYPDGVEVPERGRGGAVPERVGEPIPEGGSEGQGSDSESTPFSYADLMVT